MNRLTHPVALALAALTIGASPLLQAETSTGPDIWNQTRDTATDWWNRSKDFANQTANDARRILGPKDDFGHVWEAAVPRLEDALELEQRQAQLPESAWIGADQRSNQTEIDALLDEAVEILSVSPALRYRDRIQAIQGEIERLRAEIAEYRQKRVAAPTESAIQKTVTDYDRLIATREQEIAARNAEIEDLKHRFAEELRGKGLELGDEQVAFLLTTVVGDNMVDLGILFDNVKSMTAELEELVAESGEDLESARRYYGLYVVLLKALRRMHIQVEESVSEEYLPQIDSIIRQAQTLSGETRELMHTSPDKRDLLTANLEAQRATIEAAQMYRRYLEDQARQVEQARLELEKDIATAWNTYETVRVSGELVGLVKSSQQLLEGLMNRQVPALRPFANLQMQREFEKLTLQLRAKQ
ncbi:hypothetical protein ThidrDRAFT_2923 [Thiorhodococcus drewsii AZ1]|uniref:Uncharacterized protein n=1 Tax=Thiorhodococcus drewsii AZ1 TaxID=765913 RepID=G2E3R0_9GAMM|nr:hypothetical protein [Thiorhodococcus drewsii]EGV30002.1 hypothetical protein ThidrDRAFT_2923 [Thiorhodococcus drewsii AZ1]